MINEHRDNARLGSALEAARVAAGLSMRTLATTAGVPLTTLHRLLSGDVARPAPRHLARLADALGLARARVFELAGYPTGTAALDDLLMAEYDLPSSALPEVHAAITTVADRHRNADHPKES